MDLLKPTRRLFVGMLGALFAAPAIIRASSIMPIKAEPNWLWVPESALFDAHRRVGLDVPIREFGFENRLVVVDRMVGIENDARGKILIRAMAANHYEVESAIKAAKTDWLFRPVTDGYDRINGVSAPDSWT